MEAVEVLIDKVLRQVMDKASQEIAAMDCGAQQEEVKQLDSEELEQTLVRKYPHPR